MDRHQCWSGGVQIPQTARRLNKLQLILSASCVPASNSPRPSLGLSMFSPFRYLLYWAIVYCDHGSHNERERKAFDTRSKDSWTSQCDREGSRFGAGMRRSPATHGRLPRSAKWSDGRSDGGSRPVPRHVTEWPSELSASESSRGTDRSCSCLFEIAALSFELVL